MDRQRILFICGHYASPRYANSICVKNLAEEFYKMGCEVWVVGMNDSASQKNSVINGIHTVLLPEPFLIRTENEKEKESKLRIIVRCLLRFLHSLYSIFFYPNVDYPRSSKLYEAALQIISEVGINTIVVTYKPYSAIHCGIKIKKKFSDIRLVTYHLDLIMSPHNSSRIVRKYKNALASRKIEKELSIVDKMLLPSSAALISSEKVSYVDFPLYIPIKDKTVSIDSFKQDTINIVYVGSLDDYNRNPSYIFDVIKKTPRIYNKNVSLHVWGGISDIISKELNTNNVIYHGMANPDMVPSILANADFLLSIGNKITYSMIPSKIFQIFASKKPVLFIQKHEQDKSARYYLSYCASCVIKEYANTVQQSIEIIIDFIRDYYKKEINISDSLFEKSTPNFICKEILC